MRLNKKCKVFNMVILILVMFSCEEKDKFDDYNIYIKNISSQELNVFTYKNDIETNNIIISSNQRGYECSYSEITFGGYSDCNIDSIKFVFPNSKGYICANINDESFCFGNQINPWVSNEKFINTTGDTYEFTITEQDFENALDIP